jgi:hypothetical protein
VLALALCAPSQTLANSGWWVSDGEIAALPITSNAAWVRLSLKADEPNTVSAAADVLHQGGNADPNDCSPPAMSSQRLEQTALAAALKWKRTGNTSARDRVHGFIESLVTVSFDPNANDPNDFQTRAGECHGCLAMCRNLAGYIVAADLIDLETLDSTLHSKLLDRLANECFASTETKCDRDCPGGSHTLRTCHARRPNNIGLMCGVSRFAADLYTDDITDLGRAKTIFQAFLGGRSVYRESVAST